MKNKKVVLNIVDMSKDGLGIAKNNGVVYFVKNAIVDDCVLCVVTKTAKNIYYAKAIEILKKSKFRVCPECKICEPCGGCQIMQVEYSKQLSLKKNQVISNLTRIAGIKEEEIDSIYEGIEGVNKLYNYRNKLQIPFSYRDEKVVCGFYAERTHYIVECDECKAGFIGNGKIIKAVRDAIEKFNLSIYEENIGSGILRSIMMRSSNSVLKSQFEVSLTLVVNDKDYEKNIDLYKNICSHILKSVVDDRFKISTISININTKEGNVILSDENIIIYGNEYLKDSILGIDFYISPNSFYQVNMEMTEKLYSYILDILKLEGSENVIDLYCGIGTISLLMAKYAKHVIGIEIVEQAIKNANENKKMNSIKNADFICIEAENLMDNIKKESILAKMVCEGIDIVCVDPPRKGLDSKLIDGLIKLLPQKIIYVSCDSGTLARDLKKIIDSGKYKIDKIKNFDMFPHTMHVETVVLMSRVEGE